MRWMLLIPLALLASCFTPRQVEAQMVLHELLSSGVITQGQYEALMSALSPGTWLQDLWILGQNILVGTGVYYGVNRKRDKLREMRGEPVGKSQGGSNGNTH